MRWIRPLSARVQEPPETLGGKALGLVLLRRLGLRVPAGFVITAEACRAFLRDGRFPDGLDGEFTAAVAELEHATGRSFGGPRKPLAVSVRSGAGVSMPGMMSTVLDLGLTTEATTGLAAETGDHTFALHSRLRFLSSFASAITGTDDAEEIVRDLAEELAEVRAEEHDGGRAEEHVKGHAEGRAEGRMKVRTERRAEVRAEGHDEGREKEACLSAAVEAVEGFVLARWGRPVPDEAGGQLRSAVEAVFSSWDAPRARTYRVLNDISHELGTAVIVQEMVFGNRDGRSGTGVAFSRDPNSGENVPYGEVLFERQGDEVVSGRATTRPLRELSEREPAVWAELLDALGRIEGHYRDACYVEFTFQSGELWFLQVRPGRFAGAAAVRLAVELVDEGAIGRDEALLRVSPHHLRHVRTPRIAPAEGNEVFARGLGACPGVAVGRVATTADEAVRRAQDAPAILVRPETSPNDMHGIAAAAGIVTARGGPASHAAVVARAMGKPAVVGVTALTVTESSATTEGSATIGGRTVGAGTLLAIDGTSGEVVLGDPPLIEGTADTHLRRLLTWADDISGDHSERDEPQRLEAARTALRHRDSGTNRSRSTEGPGTRG